MDKKQENEIPENGDEYDMADNVNDLIIKLDHLKSQINAVQQVIKNMLPLGTQNRE